jgi:hypothetical protein
MPADVRIGWLSFIHGEVTAGDVLVLDAVGSALRSAGICYDTVPPDRALGRGPS